MEIDDASDDTAAARLRVFIAEGKFGPGDRLPSERTLLQQLGLGRSALRNALQDLEDEGRIWRHVGKGTFLTDPDSVARPGDPTLALARRTTPIKMMQARLPIASRRSLGRPR